MPEVLTQIESRALHKSIVNYINFFGGFVHQFQLVVETGQIEEQVWFAEIVAEFLCSCNA